MLPMFSVADQLAIVLTAVLAAVLGGLIGWERERSDKPAGTRTQSLVAAACATIVHIGLVADHIAGSGDPTRALHGVITGIGFLGASTVFRSENGGRARGVTTAATVFTTATVGVAVGIGAPLAAVLITGVVLVVLRWPLIIARLTGKDHSTIDVDED